MVVWEALDALSHQFELCKIDATSIVAVLVDVDPDPDQLALIRAAITRSGAAALQIAPMQASPHTGDRITYEPLLVAVLGATDIVITCLRERGPAINALLQDSGCRTLHLRAGDARPDNYPPHVNLRRRVLALAGAIGAGSTVHVSDQNGTALRIDLERSVRDLDYGLVNDTISTASFPAGWVKVTPARATVRGDLVLMPGDANLRARRPTGSPVRLTLADDHVTSIEGDTADADVLRAGFESANEPAALGMAGLTIGMNAGREPFGLFDDRMLDPQLCRLAAGVITVSFGHNLVADRPCEQTITLALAGRTVHIDDLPVVVGGDLQGDFTPDVYEH